MLYCIWKIKLHNVACLNFYCRTKCAHLQQVLSGAAITMEKINENVLRLLALHHVMVFSLVKCTAKTAFGRKANTK